MKKLVQSTCLLLLSAAAVLAQESGTKVFLALMQPGNEVPAITDTSSGNVIIYVHGIVDKNDNVVSGSVDFDVTTKFSAGVTVTGLHIHAAAAGVNGSIVIPTDVNGTDKSITIDSTGRTRIQKQVQFPSTSPAVALSTLQDLLKNPANYYVNIHTTVNPGGAMRGQLVPAEVTLLGAAMSTQNEVPATTVTGSGIANVAVFRGRAPNGSVALATAIFNLDYKDFAPATVFTGFHIHNGAAGINGPVIINTGLSGTNTITVDSTGGGNLNIVVPMSPLDASFANEVATVNSLFTNPTANQYINIHSTQFPGGVMRDQLRPTEAVNFDVNMLTANETPAIAGLTGTGQSNLNLLLVRGADGSVKGGTVVFDINYRNFPAPTTFTGLHIHQGAAGANGGIVIQSGVDANAGKVVSDTGNGNIFRIVNVTTDAGLAALNGIVANPNGFYVNLHTTVNPGGAMRDQLAGPLSKPAITGIGANASSVTAAAPGAIISIYGSNLSPVESGLDGFSNLTALATGMNGVTVTVGGVKAPFYYVGPSQINVQVPFEVTAGSQPVVVTNSAGSATANLTVAAAAPSIFFVDQNGTGAVVKLPDYSLIGPNNPAKAGDTLVIFLSGLGQTTPAMQTGAVVGTLPSGFYNTVPVTVTIGQGNVQAPVIASVASPGFAGLYQVAVTVPSGVTGRVLMNVRVGTVLSNAVFVNVQ
jgi:uncharacterized protein (TIGR03437 family)